MLLSQCVAVYSQHQTTIDAKLNAEAHTIDIQHEITYKNKSENSLSELYFTDWVSSYSSPTTPLVKKFLNEFNTNLYIAKKNKRGFTTIHQILNTKNEKLYFHHLETQEDILKVSLKSPLEPNASVTLRMNYSIKIQSDRFTDFGVDKKKNYALESWYLTPAVFDGLSWKLYSNQNLDDMYAPPMHTKISVTIPEHYLAYTSLNVTEIENSNGFNIYHFEGENVMETKMFFTPKEFKTYAFDSLSVITNIYNKKIYPDKEKEYFGRITSFLNQNVTPYPKKKMMLSNIEFKKNSLYGLAFLPDILSPFSKEFEHEISIAENVIKKYLNEVLVVDSRNEYWLKSGFELLLLIKYIDTYYPEQRLLGKLAKVWGVRSFNFSKLDYAEQYRLTYYQMMRTGRDQALNTKREDLMNFNQRHSAKFKAGIGLLYLKSYLEEKNELKWLKEFIEHHQFKRTTTANFQTYLGQITEKNTDWFFKDFVSNAYSSDYKITKAHKEKDSIYFSVKNLKKGAYPITVSTLKNGEEISNQWLEGFTSEQKFSIPNNGADKLVLNYKHSTPEFNRRNNWKTLNKGSLLNKPLQLRFLRDVEDPAKSQIYVIPIAEFQNIYDGLKVGLNFNNRGLLAKPFLYAFAPVYGTESKTITGFGKLVYNAFYEDGKLYNTMFGITVDRSSFDYGAFMTKIQPYIQFKFRTPKDLRSNALQKLTLRYISIQKDNSRSFTDENTIPPYNVFNVRYSDINNNIHQFKNWFFDLQLSNDFGKLNMSYEIRKRTPKDRHYNLRFFAGTFLYNSLPTGENNFDFALDRPTDYLFEYNYIGQSESSGILSQQLIIADGGFKSKTEPGFANQWLTTMNASASIWRYVQAYGDIGVVKNKFKSPFFAYDAGIRLDLITDYFEVYFPVYSNLGWEIAQEKYPQKIRFVFTTDISKLSSLLTRRWF